MLKSLSRFEKPVDAVTIPCCRCEEWTRGMSELGRRLSEVGGRKARNIKTYPCPGHRVFKSLIKKSLFILIVYNWPLAGRGHVTQHTKGSNVHNQNKSLNRKSETNTELSQSRWGHQRTFNTFTYLGGEEFRQS